MNVLRIFNDYRQLGFNDYKCFPNLYNAFAREFLLVYMKTLVFLLGLMILVGGCTQAQDPGTDAMDDGTTMDETNNDQTQEDDNMTEKVVETGSKVKVEYKGTFPDTGEVFDQSEGRGPLEFEAGAGQMIKGFDAAVIGMKLNEEKTVTIPPEDAYGVKGSGHELSGKTLQFWIKIVDIQ